MNISNKNQFKKQNVMSKLLKNTVIILFIGILFSCSKDDDSLNIGDEVNIIGTWKLISETEDGVDITDPCDLFYIFTTNEATVKYYDDETCTQQFSDTASYTLNGSTLTFTQGSETSVQEIAELSATTLKIKEVYSGITYIETFTKQ